MSEVVNIEVIEPTPVPVIEIHVDINAAQSAIDAAAAAQLILNEIAALVGSSSLNGITTLGTIAIDGDEVTFTGFAWKIAGTNYAQAAPITRTLPLASEGMYRTHTAYFTTTNDIQIAVGTESSEVTTEPNIPEGTLRMRAFNVFGETITAGPGEALPYDINLLDLLMQNPASGNFLLINVNGIDFRLDFQRLIDMFSPSSSFPFKLLINRNYNFFSGSTSEAILNILPVPAGTLKEFDFLRWGSQIRKPNGTTPGYKLWVNTSPVVPGGTQLAYYLTAAANRNIDFSRHFWILDGKLYNSISQTGSQISTISIVSNSVGTDILFDVNQDYYFIVTCINSDSSMLSECFNQKMEIL